VSKSVSIAISARDNFSTTLVTMRNSCQQFGRDLQGLQQRLDALNNTRAKLKVDVDEASRALKEARKQFEATGDAADRLALELAYANYENAKSNLEQVSKAARRAKKDIADLTGTFSKLENRAGRKGGGGGEDMGILGALASAGATKFIGDTLSDLANAYVSSAFGSEAGAYFSSALSGAATGAAIGSVIPGVGTAIGAIGGALAGLVQGAIQVFENQDEAFKQYYADQYEKVTEQTDSVLEAGTSIASIREQNLIAFSTLLGGRENAEKYLDEMIRFAAETPFGYSALADISRTLLAYGYKQDELLPLLAKVGDAGAALGMSNDDMVRVATALGRMQTTGKTTLEYLNPLLERGIPVWDYLAQASGKTKEEVQEMVSKGLVPGAEAAKAIADYMGSDFAGSMALQAETYAGLVSTLEDAQESLQNAVGEGYTSMRKSGIQSQIDFIEGEAGAALEEAYRVIGAGMAALENEKERIQREVLTSIVTGTIQEGVLGLDSEDRVRELILAYNNAKTVLLSAVNEQDQNMARIRMKSILEEAAAIAENEFNSSEIQQAYVDSQLELANSLKDNASLNSAYWDYGYRMGRQFSKGYAAAVSEDFTWGDFVELQKNTLNAANKPPAGIPRVPAGSAYGIQRVPYNNFPALLHEGERVLTASEARAYNSRQNASVMITGNTFVVREDADIDRIAQELARRLERAQMLAQ